MNLTLNLSLWIAAGPLAVVFLVSSAKLFVPKEKMALVMHADGDDYQTDPVGDSGRPCRLRRDFRGSACAR